MIEVVNPPTGISVAPTIVRAEGLSGSADMAATTLIRLNAELGALRPDGMGTDCLSHVLEQLGTRVIPGFCVGDEVTADALSAFVSETGIHDAFVLAGDPKLVARVRQAVPMIRGVLDLREQRGDSAHAIRRSAGAALSRTVILSGSSADRATVESLQRLLLTVWLSDEADQSGKPQPARLFNLVATGANGIVTKAPDALAELLGNAFPQDHVSLVRGPFVIGHRGVPSLAPENTLEGAELAFRYGADMIENDIQLTRDRVVVIHHDATLERTTTGEGQLHDLTGNELRRLRANVQFPEEYPEATVPTLREFIEAFGDRDAVHVIELKSPDPETARRAAALLREMDAESQAVFISFLPEQIRVLQEVLPDTSCGLLTAGQVDEAAPLESVRRVLEAIQPLACTYHPRASGIGRPFLEAACHRGITTWPWTIRDHATFVELFLAGASGITTDFCQWASDWIRAVEAPEDTDISVGQTLNMRATIRCYGHAAHEAVPHVTIISGHEFVLSEGANVTGIRTGEAWFALRCWQQVAPGKGYFMTSPAACLQVHAS